MKLKPCPFCNRKRVKFIVDPDYPKYFKGVDCKCGVNVYFFNSGINIGWIPDNETKSKQNVIKAWNNRNERSDTSSKG